MKILLVVNDISGNDGWSAYANNVIAELVRDKNQVIVAVQNITNINVKQYQILYPPLYLLWNPIRVLFQWLRIRKIIKKETVDLIHVISEPYVQPFSFAVGLKIPIILTIHGTYANVPMVIPTSHVGHYISTLLFRKALSKVDKIIAVSVMTRERFIKSVPTYNESNITVIRNSITVGKESERQKQSSEKCIHIITIGEVKPRKGIHTSIDLFSRWSTDRRQDVIYDVVGSYSEHSEYGKEIQKKILQCSSDHFKVHMHGKVSQARKIELLQKASLYVHLEKIECNSVYVEGFGISIIEAASFGIPALVARGSATTEAVKDGKTGFIVDLEDERGVHVAIDDLLVHTVISIDDVVQWAKEHSPERAYKEIRKVYQHVLE